jgi:hypothetical protein
MTAVFDAANGHTPCHTPTVHAPVMDTGRSTTMELREILDGTADRVVADGTHAESWALQMMEAAARDLCPGAAAALIDWDGSEIARLRAFGIVHGVLLRELPATAQTQLASQLVGVSAHELAA